MEKLAGPWASDLSTGTTYRRHLRHSLHIKVGLDCLPLPKSEGGGKK